MLRLYLRGFIGCLLVAVAIGCQSKKIQQEPKLFGSGRVDRVVVLRLLPGEDVRAQLEHWTSSEGVAAASIVSAVGSLKVASVRFAEMADATNMVGPFEVVSLSGLLSQSGSHLHLSISNSKGLTVGGHLGIGSLVNTTLEVVVAIYRDMNLIRLPDPRTGYNELFVETSLGR